MVAQGSVALPGSMRPEGLKFEWVPGVDCPCPECGDGDSRPGYEFESDTVFLDANVLVPEYRPEYTAWTWSHMEVLYVPVKVLLSVYLCGD